MKYVYLIKSESHANETYVGVTSDLNKRLTNHNRGGSVHTSKFKPRKLVTYTAFSEDSKALEFEVYLKTGSGRAFAKKDCGKQKNSIQVKRLRTSKIYDLIIQII